MKRALSSYFLAVAGLGLLATAVFAQQLGLDHNAAWGIRRSLLLGGGALLLVIAAMIQWRQRTAGTIGSWVRSVVGTWMRLPLLQFLRKHRLSILVSFGFLLILASYAFLSSLGTWTTWPENSRYYDDLATALLDGHTYLNVKPPGTFLALVDPYDPAARNQTPELRAFADTVYDLSFFRGRFYLYWAPAPALLLAVLKLFYGGPIPDQFLVFGFLVGLLIFTMLIILEVRRRFYEDMPVSLVLAGIAVAALSFPIPALLSNAGIYEATIAAGQFFLIAGLYFASVGLEHQPALRMHLLLASTFWALAAASRTLILLPAAALTFMLIVWETSHRRKPAAGLHSKTTPVMLALPLTIVVLVLGCYNWSRFGSVLETGYRYALTLDNLNGLDSQSFSLSYAGPNVWMYVFNPFQTQSHFPFVSATAAGSRLFPYVGEVGRYHVEPVTGLLFVVPFVLFSIVAFAKMASLASSEHFRPGLEGSESLGQWLLWTFLSLTGGLVLPLAVVLFYYDVRMRYLAEFVPSLMLLSVLGVFQGYHSLQGKALFRSLYKWCAIGVALASASLGLLLTLAENHSRFRQYNPQLIKQLILFFAR